MGTPSEIKAIYAFFNLSKFHNFLKICSFIQCGSQTNAFPPLLNYPTCTEQDPTVEIGRGDADHSVLATEGMVPGPSGVTHRGTLTSARKEKTPSSIPQRKDSRKPSSPPATCLEAVKHQVREEGFSKAVAEQVASARGPSTMRNYQSKRGVYKS